MKIFWSWQSDTPGKVGRHFIREALEAAIAELKAAEELELTPADREELHLDHDRKGIPGSPSLAETILKKIEASTVFVADVTPVALTENGKAVPNPNVMIELGFAQAKLGDEQILMVLNSSFGQRESLPFDLRHKAGPLLFNLSADAGMEQRKEEKKKLVGSLKIALRDYLVRGTQLPEQAAHFEIQSTSSPARYFKVGEPLADRGEATLTYPEDASLLYLRLIPTRALPEASRNDVKTWVSQADRPSPLTAGVTGNDISSNLYGWLVYMQTGGQLQASTQIFRNREIWGLNAWLLRAEKNGSIPMAAVEKALTDSLWKYMFFARDSLSLSYPLRVEVGAAPVAGFRLRIDQWTESGRIYDESIRSRQTLNSYESQEIERVLLQIFEDFFDAASAKRPPRYQGFPRELVLLGDPPEAR